MDCEGAEYEVLEDLSATGTLKNVDLIMIEWHDKGAQIIEELLINSGFNFFARDLGSISGLIYAYKK